MTRRLSCLIFGHDDAREAALIDRNDALKRKLKLAQSEAAMWREEYRKSREHRWWKFG